MNRSGILVFLGAIALLIFVGTNARAQNPFSGAQGFTVTMTKEQTGIASWYGRESGTKTASGRKFNPAEMTCAMRRRDWGSVLTVTVIATGKSAECTLTDFGPAKWTGRIIDVSEGMAKRLGFHRRGVVRVRVGG